MSWVLDKLCKTKDVECCPLGLFVFARMINHTQQQIKEYESCKNVTSHTIENPFKGLALFLHFKHWRPFNVKVTAD